MFYDFFCKKCNIYWEKRMSMNDEHVDFCPVCKEKIHSCITGGSGFIFKGEGFPSHDSKKAKEFSTDTKKYYNEADNVLPGKKGTGR